MPSYAYVSFMPFLRHFTHTLLAAFQFLAINIFEASFHYDFRHDDVMPLLIFD